MIQNKDIYSHKNYNWPIIYPECTVYKGDNGIGEEVDIKYETCDVWRYKKMKVNITYSQSWIDEKT